MLLHQKVTCFNAYLTYKRLKVLFPAQKTRLMLMNQNKTNVNESMQNQSFEYQKLGILRFHSSGCNPSSVTLSIYK